MTQYKLYMRNIQAFTMCQNLIKLYTQAYNGKEKPHGTRFYRNGANKEIVQKYNGQLQRQGTKEETKLFHQADRTD